MTSHKSRMVDMHADDGTIIIFADLKHDLQDSTQLLIQCWSTFLNFNL